MAYDQHRSRTIEEKTMNISYGIAMLSYCMIWYDLIITGMISTICGIDVLLYLRDALDDDVKP
jgi:hypothetical protein